MLKIGHRGARGYEPENTLRSFEKALTLQVDAVEFDVHVCKSGELVVIHDDTVERTTNGNGYVRDMDLEELRSLDAGKGQRIPLVEEVLDLIDKRVIVNVELKGPDTAEPVAALIKKYMIGGWDKDLFQVSSFDHYELTKFHDALPEIQTGALITGIPIGYADFGEKAKSNSVNLSQEFITRAFVGDAHARGLKVYVYTVNTPEDIERIKALDVDGIFSDYPDRL